MAVFSAPTDHLSPSKAAKKSLKTPMIHSTLSLHRADLRISSHGHDNPLEPLSGRIQRSRKKVALSTDTFPRNTLAGGFFRGERLDSCRGHARAEVKKDSCGGPVAVRRQTGRKALSAASGGFEGRF